MTTRYHITGGPDPERLNEILGLMDVDDPALAAEMRSGDPLAHVALTTIVALVDQTPTKAAWVDDSDGNYGEITTTPFQPRAEGTPITGVEVRSNDKEWVDDITTLLADYETLEARSGVNVFGRFIIQSEITS